MEGWATASSNRECVFLGLVDLQGRNGNSNEAEEGD
jgi:hypothetical protein